MLITREIQVDAGHRIAHHGGMCQGLHGHRYRIVCTVSADEPGTGEEADMAMDFQRLKRIMMEQIHRDHDHALILQADDPLVPVVLGPEMAETARHIADTRDGKFVGSGVLCSVGRVEHGTRFVLIPHAPTAERLAEYWGANVARAVNFETKGRAALVQIEVWETPNCSALWSPAPDMEF